MFADPGTVMRSSGGTITGTPNTAGTFTGTVTASNGVAPDATQAFSITINGLAILCRDQRCGGRPMGYNLEEAFERTIIGGPGIIIYLVLWAVMPWRPAVNAPSLPPSGPGDVVR